jgi:hypothetical protein
MGGSGLWDDSRGRTKVRENRSLSVSVGGEMENRILKRLRASNAE